MDVGVASVAVEDLNEGLIDRAFSSKVISRASSSTTKTASELDSSVLLAFSLLHLNRLLLVNKLFCAIFQYSLTVSSG